MAAKRFKYTLCFVCDEKKVYEKCLRISDLDSVRRFVANDALETDPRGLRLNLTNGLQLTWNNIGGVKF